MKYYLVHHKNFTWSLLCTSDINNCDMGEKFYEEISYEEFITNIDFMSNINE